MFRRLLNVFRPNRLEAEILEELSYHRDRTRGSFGNLAAIQDQSRDASTIVWLNTFLQDIRYGLRQLARTPLVTLVAVLSLALGIGANTAIFTVINAVMLQSLPVRDPGGCALLMTASRAGCTTETPSPVTSSHTGPGVFPRPQRSLRRSSAFRQATDDLMIHLPSSRGRRSRPDR